MLLSKSLGKDRANRKRRGLTLIEAAMVLAILALVIAGVMIFYQNASNNQKLTQAQQQIIAVQQAVNQMYAGQSSKTGLDEADIIESLPSSQISGTTIKNPYNGTISVAAVSTGFTIASTNVPEDACQRLATVDMGRQTQALNIGGNANTSLPVAPGTARTQCAGGNKTMTWTFY